jgi:hypothetical protein
VPNVPPIVTQEKSIWKSRVLWLNALGLVIIILGIIIDNAAPLALPSQIVSYLGVLLAIANAVLRFIPPAIHTDIDP